MVGKCAKKEYTRHINQRAYADKSVLYKKKEKMLRGNN